MFGGISSERLLAKLLAPSRGTPRGNAREAVAALRKDLRFMPLAGTWLDLLFLRYATPFAVTVLELLPEGIELSLGRSVEVTGSVV
jgi:hypothetical protein